MCPLAALVLLVLLDLPIFSWAQETSPADADPLAIGRRIYREGVLPSGLPLQGLAPANVKLSGADAACVTCHRRSGFGASEGPIEVRPVTGPALFGTMEMPSVSGLESIPVLTPVQSALSASEVARAKADTLRVSRAATFAGNRQRPVYDDALLARAIHDGLDVTGHKMSASMPRYALAQAELASLSSYLKTLSAHVSPGVTKEAVHFATVIQPDTDPAQRRVLVEVLQKFFEDRNMGLRVEVRREAAGIVRLKRSYREWVLHVWDLSGTSDTWAAQLEAYNRQQPVFALISGLGNLDWHPIHEFSERFELPCIFPQVDVPVLADHDFYTVYLSRGMTLEAQVLAKYLQGESERGPVVQVFRRDAASAAAANAFRQAWRAGSGTAPLDRLVDQTPDEAYWQQLTQQFPGATLVLWLPAEDLMQARALTAADSRVKVIYLSSSLNPGQRAGLAADGEGRVRLVFPQDMPVAREARLEVLKRWLGSKGIALTDEKVQWNAYLAAKVTGLMMSHSMDTYSSEVSSRCSMRSNRNSRE